MKHNMIVALCKGTRGIGYQNRLPWKYPQELRLFRKLTSQHYCDDTHEIYDALYMGTNTYYHLPRDLPKRDLFIISRKPKQVIFRPEIPHSGVFTSIQECIHHAEYLKYKSLWCIGGASIYNHALNSVIFDTIYETQIQKHYHCDTYIDDLPPIYNKVMDHEYENDLGKVIFKLNVYDLI